MKCYKCGNDFKDEVYLIGSKVYCSSCVRVSQDTYYNLNREKIGNIRDTQVFSSIEELIGILDMDIKSLEGKIIEFKGNELYQHIYNNVISNRVYLKNKILNQICAIEFNNTSSELVKLLSSIKRIEDEVISLQQEEECNKG